jgi:hypothetical protein
VTVPLGCAAWVCRLGVPLGLHRLACTACALTTPHTNLCRDLYFAMHVCGAATAAGPSTGTHDGVADGSPDAHGIPTSSPEMADTSSPDDSSHSSDSQVVAGSGVTQTSHYECV